MTSQIFPFYVVSQDDNNNATESSEKFINDLSLIFMFYP